jgi:hypothetical protein
VSRRGVPPSESMIKTEFRPSAAGLAKCDPLSVRGPAREIIVNPAETGKRGGLRSVGVSNPNLYSARTARAEHNPFSIWGEVGKRIEFRGRELSQPHHRSPRGASVDVTGQPGRSADSQVFVVEECRVEGLRQQFRFDEAPSPFRKAT